MRHAIRSSWPGVVLALVLILAIASDASAETPVSASNPMTPVRLLERQGRWADAESLATVVLARVSQPPADSLAMADALYSIGSARVSRTAFADRKGRTALEQCLGIRERHLGPDHPDVGSTEVMLGRLLASSGKPDSALAHLERGLRIRMAKLAPGDTLIGDAWVQLAFAHRNLRDYPTALQDFQHTLDIRKAYHGPDHPVIGTIMAQMGYCLDMMQEYDRSRTVLEQSLDIVTRALGPDAMRRVVPLDYLAGLETDVGDHARALALSNEALRVALANRPPDDPEVQRIRRNLANTLVMFGDYAGIRQQLEPLLPWYETRRGPDDYQTIDICLTLGVAYAGLNDSTAAMRYLRRVERSLSAHSGMPGPNLPYSAAWQARVLFASGDTVNARAACERGLVYARSARRPSGYALALLNYTLIEVLLAGSDTTALDSTDRSLERDAITYDLRSTTTAPIVDYWHARVAARLGRPEAAWQYAQAAFKRSHDQIGRNVRALPDGRALELSYEDIRHLDVALDVARFGPGEWQQTAWDELVRTRGVVRAELARRRLPLGLRADTALVRIHDAWADAQRAYARRLVVSGGGSRDSAESARLAALATTAEQTERDYIAALARHQTTVAPPEAGLADVRARLSPGQALVSLVEVDAPTDTSRMLAFVARGGESSFTLLDLGPTRRLRDTDRPWLARLAEPPAADPHKARDAERACRDAGRAARAAVWDPIARSIGDARDVYLVPDGPLLDFPWQALPDGESAYLVEKGPRLHVLNAEWEMVAPREAVQSGSMLAVGDPDFENTPPAGSAASGPALAALNVRSAPDPCAGGELALTPLPASATEARDVAHAWLAASPDHTAEVLIGRDATEAVVKSAAPGRAILHFATHAVVARDTCTSGPPVGRGVGGITTDAGSTGTLASNTAPVGKGSATKSGAKSATKTATPSTEPVPDAAPSPWADRRIWLALAGANHARAHETDENEGLLTAEEVVTLDLAGTDWVVLSACHTGFASTRPREGAQGLRRAFHLAGAHTVIASDWAVEDAATREWMDALYDARRGGATRAADAMSVASRSVLAARRREHRSTHPFYWAAFTASGE
jgi:CHAT domain-containing protein/tetratricopeptide (TPR) repeat protein